MKKEKITEKIWPKMTIVFIFAVAMAFLESAVVIYLRSLFNIVGELKEIKSSPNILIALPFFALLQPKDLFTVLPDSIILKTELIREATTIIMIFTFAWMGGRNLKEKAAIFLLTFGVWDIFYYIFLYIILGWPSSLKTIDVLFLIPVPWVAPVFVPITISLGMILLAILLLKSKRKERVK